MLYAVTSTVATSVDLDELLSTILDAVLPLLDSDTDWAMLPGPTLDDLPHAAWHGIPKSVLAAEMMIPLCTWPVYMPLLARGDAQTEPILIAECYRLPLEVLASASLIHRHWEFTLA